MANSSRFEKTVTRCLVRAVRQRRLLWLILAVLSLGAAAALCRTQFSSDITALLPPDSESGRGFALLRKCGLAETVRIELCCADGAAQSAPALDRAAAALAELPEVRSVAFRYSAGEGGDWMEELCRSVPLLAVPPELREEDLRKQAAALRRILLTPAGGALLSWTGDWSRISGGVLKNLEKLRALSGLAPESGCGFPVSSDGRRTVMRLELESSCTEAFQAEKALRALEDCLRRTLPEGISFQIHAPHRHAIANAGMLKRDIQLACWGALLILGAVFFVLYRGSCASLFVPLLPLPAALLALGLVALIFDRIWLFVIGLGGGVAGIAVDQGIHVYAANQSAMGIRRTARIFPALLLGGLTSVGVFALLPASDIPGYRQMGWFAGVALLLNLLFSLFLLPGLVGGRSRKTLPDALLCRSAAAVPPRRAVGLWLIFLVCGALLWTGVGSDFGPGVFDATPEAVQRGEKAFQARWRDGEPPDMILVESASRDEALERSRDLAAALEARGAEAVGAGTFYAGSAAAGRCREAWRKWIETGGFDRASALWRKVLHDYGLPPDWSGALEERWRYAAMERESGTPPACFEVFLKHLVRRSRDGKWIAVVLFAEGAENRAAARAAASSVPGAAVVSPRRFGELLARDWCIRIAWLLAAAFSGVILATWVYFRSVRSAALALAPVLTMLAGIGIALYLTGLKVNLIAGFSGVILAGLTIDYGIFAVSALERPEIADDLRKAMAASALTTAAATGILLFARHPVLFQTGVMFCAGVSAAACGALHVVPKLAELGGRGRGRKLPGILCLIGALAVLTGCRGVECFDEALPPLERTEAELRAELAAWRARKPAKQDLCWRGVMEFGEHHLPLLMLGERGEAGAMELAVLTPLGLKMYELEGRGGALEHYELSLTLQRLDRKSAAEVLYQDCEALFGGNHPEVAETTELHREASYVTFTLPNLRGEPVQYYFAGNPLRLVRKVSRDFRGRRWQADYPCNSWRSDGKTGEHVLQMCSYRNFRVGYRQKLRRGGGETCP